MKAGDNWINALFDMLVTHASKYAPSKREVKKWPRTPSDPLPLTSCRTVQAAFTPSVCRTLFLSLGIMPQVLWYLQGGLRRHPRKEHAASPCASHPSVLAGGAAAAHRGHRAAPPRSQQQQAGGAASLVHEHVAPDASQQGCWRGASLGGAHQEDGGPSPVKVSIAHKQVTAACPHACTSRLTTSAPQNWTLPMDELMLDEAAVGNRNRGSELKLAVCGGLFEEFYNSRCGGDPPASPSGWSRKPLTCV